MIAKRIVFLGSLIVGSLMWAADAQAQSCVGMPASPGGVFAGGQFETEPDWGAEFGFTSPGTIGVRGQYLWEPPVDDPSVENESHSISVLGAMAFDAGSLELCPGIGLEYEARVRTPDNVEIWSVPVGVGLGREIRLGSGVSMTPFLFPQAVYVTGRPQFETVIEGGDRFSVRTDDSEAVDARLDVGAIFQSHGLYASAAARVQTDFEVPEGTRTVIERHLILTVGWLF